MSEQTRFLLMTVGEVFLILFALFALYWFITRMVKIDLGFDKSDENDKYGD